MAGKPKTKALHERLSDPAAEAQVWDWYADGRTWRWIGQQFGVSRTAMYEWIEAGGEERKRIRSRARIHAAESKVEDATEGLETADESNWKQRKEIAGHNRWLAERMDRETWGQQTAGNVTINISDLHLQLLRTTIPPALPSVPETQVIEATQDVEYLPRDVASHAPQDSASDEPAPPG